MNWVVVGLGGLLIAIGFVIVVRPGNLPGFTNQSADPYVRLPFPPPKDDHPDPQSPRRTLVRVLIGLGVMVLGGLCIVLWH